MVAALGGLPRAGRGPPAGAPVHGLGVQRSAETPDPDVNVYPTPHPPDTILVLSAVVHEYAASLAAFATTLHAVHCRSCPLGSHPADSNVPAAHVAHAEHSVPFKKNSALHALHDAVPCVGHAVFVDPVPIVVPSVPKHVHTFSTQLSAVVSLPATRW